VALLTGWWWLLGLLALQAIKLPRILVIQHNPMRLLLFLPMLLAQPDWRWTSG
jgi:hypothetical protein